MVSKPKGLFSVDCKHKFFIFHTNQQTCKCVNIVWVCRLSGVFNDTGGPFPSSTSVDVTHNPLHSLHHPLHLNLPPRRCSSFRAIPWCSPPNTYRSSQVKPSETHIHLLGLFLILLAFTKAVCSSAVKMRAMFSIIFQQLNQKRIVCSYCWFLILPNPFWDLRSTHSRNRSYACTTRTHFWMSCDLCWGFFSLEIKIRQLRDGKIFALNQRFSCLWHFVIKMHPFTYYTSIRWMYPWWPEFQVRLCRASVVVWGGCESVSPWCVCDRPRLVSRWRSELTSQILLTRTPVSSGW